VSEGQRTRQENDAERQTQGSDTGNNRDPSHAATPEAEVQEGTEVGEEDRGRSRARTGSRARTHSADHTLHRILEKMLERDAERDERLQMYAATPAVNPVITQQTVKAKDPRPYDGSDNRYAREFLTSCRIVFLAHPDQFQSDKAKVLYAGSFLAGTARTWFEPIVEEEDWDLEGLQNNWYKFQEKEQQVFDLRMKDDHRISEYLTNFRRLVAKLDWSEDGVLKAQFRRGLAPRIKDKLANKERQPSTYDDLVSASLSLDTAYWRREEERKRERGGNTKTFTTYTEERSHFVRDNRSPSYPPKPFLRTATKKVNFVPRPQGNFSSQTSFRPAYQSNPRPPYPSSRQSPGVGNLLGRDGNLKGTERQRRIDEGLCLYCGDAGHKVPECPKKPAASGFRASGFRAGPSSGFRSGKA
jgi:hypothetical protein